MSRPEPDAEPIVGLHNLAPAPGSRKSRKRVGRGHGSGHGKTAGRGHKGYGSRAGAKDRDRFEGGQTPIHMRLPKLKGFKSPFKVTYQVVNLDRLEALFPDGGEVTPESLLAKGAVRPRQPVKILGTGEINVAVQVSAHAFSGAARTKIEAAGGSATTL